MKFSENWLRTWVNPALSSDELAHVLTMAGLEVEGMEAVAPAFSNVVVAEVLDFPGVLSQGFDLADARLMIASALQDMASLYLEQGRAIPLPDPDAVDAEADLIELLPLSLEAGVERS